MKRLVAKRRDTGVKGADLEGFRLLLGPGTGPGVAGKREIARFASGYEVLPPVCMSGGYAGALRLIGRQLVEPVSKARLAIMSNNFLIRP
ncbi:hypothetical protein ACVMIH_002244 [Bradyrhizobium sp. USDA 4503]